MLGIAYSTTAIMEEKDMQHLPQVPWSKTQLEMQCASVSHTDRTRQWKEWLKGTMRSMHNDQNDSEHGFALLDPGFGLLH